MRIDDKAIGHDGFTVLSSSDTGKIAMPVETATADGVESAMEKIGGCLRKIKNLSMNMIPAYAPVFNSFVPQAVQVADKFHEMKYVYEVEVRNVIVRDLQNSFSKGRRRTGVDKKLLAEIELLRRASHSITQLPDKWNSEKEETMHPVFSNHEGLKNTYQICQNFKR